MQNRAEYRNGESNNNEFTNQKNILSHKWFKNLTDLENCLELILIVKLLIYELLLCAHKRHQIFETFKGFRGSFNKIGYVNDSVKQYYDHTVKVTVRSNNKWVEKCFNNMLLFKAIK